MSTVVSRMTRVDGERRSTSLVISTPSMCSIWTSVMRTSTWCDCRNRRTARGERDAVRTLKSSTSEK